MSLSISGLRVNPTDPSPFQLIDEEMQNLEKLKNSKINKKQDVDKLEESTAEIRKRLSASQKDITSVQKQVTALETRLEQKKADRHSLFQTCKVSS